MSKFESYINGTGETFTQKAFYEIVGANKLLPGYRFTDAFEAIWRECGAFNQCGDLPSWMDPNTDPEEAQKLLDERFENELSKELDHYRRFWDLLND